MITTKKFGIEIEFVGASLEQVARAIRLAGVDCYVESWNHITREHWKIVTDSSLSSQGGFAGEIVSPILQGPAGVDALKKVCAALNSVAGVTVNRSCGLHVHLDCNDMTMQQIRTVYERYADYEAQIDLVMPRSRRDSPRWCRSIKDRKDVYKTSTSKSDGAARLGRYHKVNLTNIATRGSMEFRQHAGTTDFTKIYNWLEYLMSFVEKSIELSASTTKIKPKSRWFNAVRNSFENAGYTFVWSRRLKAWEVSNDERVLGALTNADIQSCYYNTARKVLNTSKPNGSDVCNPLVRRLAEQVGANRMQADLSFENKTHTAESTATDTGWLDGVAQQVVDYMAERQEELN